MGRFATVFHGGEIADEELARVRETVIFSRPELGRKLLRFWILLILSAVFYFLGGFTVGRVSPSIGMKEPLTAGIFAWFAFEVVLVIIGAAGTAQMFTIFIGAPAFIGAALIGAAIGEKSAEP